MTKKEILDAIHGKMIISCQAVEGEPLYVEEKSIMYLMARAAKQAGTPAIRTSSIRDVIAIKEETGLPVIGLVKIQYPGYEGYITPTMKEIDELVEAHVEIIALDATSNLRPNNVTLEQFFNEIKAKYPHQLLMADCSTVEEAIFADQLGFDYIGTTLVGYTDHSKHLKIETDDFKIIRDIIAQVKHKVIAEGNINTPEKARRVLELGAYSVVVGSIITRPQLITKSFVDAIEGL